MRTAWGWLCADVVILESGACSCIASFTLAIKRVDVINDIVLLSILIVKFYSRIYAIERLKSLLHLFRILESIFLPCFASLHNEFCEFIGYVVIPFKNIDRSFVKNRVLTASPRIDMT